MPASPRTAWLERHLARRPPPPSPLWKREHLKALRCGFRCAPQRPRLCVWFQTPLCVPCCLAAEGGHAGRLGGTVGPPTRVHKWDAAGRPTGRWDTQGGVSSPSSSPVPTPTSCSTPAVVPIRAPPPSLLSLPLRPSLRGSPSPSSPCAVAGDTPRRGLRTLCGCRPGRWARPPCLPASGQATRSRGQRGRHHTTRSIWHGGRRRWSPRRRRRRLRHRPATALPAGRRCGRRDGRRPTRGVAAPTGAPATGCRGWAVPPPLRPRPAGVSGRCPHGGAWRRRTTTTTGGRCTGAPPLTVTTSTTPRGARGRGARLRRVRWRRPSRLADTAAPTIATTPPTGRQGGIRHSCGSDKARTTTTTAGGTPLHRPCAMSRARHRQATGVRPSTWQAGWRPTRGSAAPLNAPSTAFRGWAAPPLPRRHPAAAPARCLRERPPVTATTRTSPTDGRCTGMTAATATGGLDTGAPATVSRHARRRCDHYQSVGWRSRTRRRLTGQNPSTKTGRQRQRAPSVSTAASTTARRPGTGSAGGPRRATARPDGSPLCRPCGSGRVGGGRRTRHPCYLLMCQTWWTAPAAGPSRLLPEARVPRQSSGGGVSTRPPPSLSTSTQTRCPGHPPGGPRRRRC